MDPETTDEAVPYGTCPRCGYVMLPVLPQLPCGHDEEPVLAPLGTDGTVYSWTRVRLGDGAERVMAMVDFLEGRLRVTAPVLDQATVAIGDRMHLTTGNDTPYVLHPAFPPAPPAGPTA